MTQDVLFARSSAEKPAQIPEECFCRETTVLCDVPDPYVHVLFLPGVHRSLTHPTSLTLRPPRKHMGHGPTVSHENSSWSKQCALKNCNRIEKNQNEPLKIYHGPNTTLPLGTTIDAYVNCIHNMCKTTKPRGWPLQKPGCMLTSVYE